MLTEFYLNKLYEKTKNKRVLVYGAGILADEFFQSNNISNLNIIGVADKKYTDRNGLKFHNFPAYPPEEITNMNYDTLLVLLKEPEYISDIMQSAKENKKEVIIAVNDLVQSFCKDNKIIIVENGTEKYASERDLPAEINIRYTDKCKNNTVKIELPQNHSKITINFQNVTNCLFDIKTTKYYIGDLFVHFGESSDMKIKIGKDVSIISANIFTNQGSSEIEIGEDCMLASNVKIVGGDGHQICDMTTGEIINAFAGKCRIGNHVWLGDDTRVMKKAVISDGSVLGANSVAAKKFDEPNVIIAGNPAKIIRRNILWKRDIVS